MTKQPLPSIESLASQREFEAMLDRWKAGERPADTGPSFSDAMRVLQRNPRDRAVRIDRATLQVLCETISFHIYLLEARKQKGSSTPAPTPAAEAAP